VYLFYNDYELLYLINEGETPALKMIFRKYEHLIYTKVLELYPYGDKSDDLVQEGRIVLFNCIKNYIVDSETSFYTYFLVSLKRKLGKELSLDYYKPVYSFRDSADNSYSFEAQIMDKLFYQLYGNDKLAILVYKENIQRGISLLNIAELYKIPYLRLVRKKDIIVQSIKKYID